MMVGSEYSRGYAAAITAATATIGPIIPPSIPLVSRARFGHLYSVTVLGGTSGAHYGHCAYGNERG